MRFLKIQNVSQLDVDSVERTIQHGRVIRSKRILRNLYIDWYNSISEFVKYETNRNYIELGSGSGFIKEIMPSVVTSDVLDIPGLNLIFDATKMPFEDESVDAIIMIDVFHHIPDVSKFLSEARRVLKKGGLIVMSEPCNSLWSRFIYKRFHHEPFNTKGDWKLDSNNPLSSANGALPWIVFERDVSKFENKFPEFKIVLKKYHTPLMYLLSGGVSFKQLIPNVCEKIIKYIDKKLASSNFSMFVFYVIKKL